MSPKIGPKKERKKRWKLEEKARKIRKFVWEVKHLSNKNFGGKRAGERKGNYEENKFKKIPQSYRT